MKRETLVYTAPSLSVLHFQAETAFLGSNTPGNGSIPKLEEGEVPDDLWG